MTEADSLELTPDELAGIVGLFGALHHEELADACSELAYKRTGEQPDEGVLRGHVEEALDGYHLVKAPGPDGPYLIVGPTAFPTLPPLAEDLPHLLDIDERTVDRAASAEALIDELEEELAGGVDESRRQRIAQLSYDLETWADVDARSLRNET